MSNISPYPRGSEWRKWDLHIHTPKSIIQEYGGDTPENWNAFMQKIASLDSSIKVIGITDYLFCDGYEYLISRKSEISNIDLILLNIEFRLNTFSGTEDNNKRHNFHVLFDPEVEVDVIREQFLNCLSSGYKIQDNTEWQQTPTRRSLEELGRQIKVSAPEENNIHNKSDLIVGFENITYKREDILKQLNKNCFKGRFVTAIGYSEWDQSRWDQSAAEKRTLINTANFCLTSLDNPSTISENRDDLITNKLHSLILHSSDAHKIDRIGQSLLWVKADPTFSGLKQLINEPIARVFIGNNPPNYKPDHKVITQISIPSSNGWFKDNFKLNLNRDLITIIGGRGSGKSALAEAIAYGAGSKDESEDAFLEKATKHKKSINGTKIRLKWADDTTTEYEVGKLAGNHDLIRYLPQGAVEELCSLDNSEMLQKQIENVIFQALDETERMGASNFDELKLRVLSSYKYEKDQIAKKIRDINGKLCNLLGIINKLPGKEKLLSDKKKELEALQKSLPELPNEDKKGQEELSTLLEIKKKFETKIIGLQGNLGKIIEIETKVKIFKSAISEFKEEISILLSALNINDTETFEVKLNEEKIKDILENIKIDISGKIKSLKEGSKTEVAKLLEENESDIPFDNLLSLNKGIEQKQKETRAFETVKLKYQRQKKAISELESLIRALSTEVDTTKKQSKLEKDTLETGRLDYYCSYFKLLKSEKNEIEKLYKPLQDSLSTGTDTDKKLKFEAKINYRLDQHCKSGLNVLDRTRKGNYRELGSLEQSISVLWDDYVRHDFSKITLQKNIKKLLQSFVDFEKEILTIESQLRETCTIQDFYDWFFDLSNFEIISSLKFYDTDLYLLSPGQKGIILLMLYLEIDKADYRPLIIDQPEENLDNLSVYKDLIDYFRERKQYRQIIMVTHNPNLVVNTDAEQIIVANYNGKRTPRLEYCSGSLEDQAKRIPNITIERYEDGIIEQVCNILEGGDTAFNRRKDKYLISARISK